MSKRVLLAAVTVLFAAGLCGAQQQEPAKVPAVSFKKLMNYLPKKAPDGYTLAKPTGETQTVMGMSNSFAQVVMNTPAKEGEEAQPGITVKITDTAGGPMAGMLPFLQTEHASETESGSEKSYKYKNFWAIEKTDSTDGAKNCSLQLIVNNRFFVEMDAATTDDIKMLYAIADAMDLEGLGKES